MVTHAHGDPATAPKAEHRGSGQPDAARDTRQSGGIIPQRRWSGLLMVIDLGVGFACMNAAVLVLYARNQNAPLGRYQLAAQLLPFLWVATLWAVDAYDHRYLATGVEEFRRIATGGAWLITLTAATIFALNIPVSRGFVLAGGLATIATTLVSRYAARRSLHRLFQKGAVLHRAIIVGHADAARRLRSHIDKIGAAGIRVVELRVPPAEPAGVGEVNALIERARAVRATMIVVAEGSATHEGDLRRLSWLLEGTGIDLVVAPSITDVAGPRVRVTPLSGLPLLHVEEPAFEGGRRVAKELFDRVTALILAALTLPACVLISIAIKVGDGGPIFYKQERIGKRGSPFTIWKFRTMRDVEHAPCEATAYLVKHANDPRVTRVGRFLRRFSLDELPQLWNVLAGSMSMVGPRPHLESELRILGEDAQRRLLVKPGITGLWQISGRSQIPGEQAISLDLYYVDNWSIGLDLLILWKTLAVVAVGRGAY